VLLSCKKKPVACIRGAPTTASVYDTIKFTSCSENADVHFWRVDDDWLNKSWENSSDNHLVVDGAENCETWIALYFYNPGTYTIDLEVASLTEGTCVSSYKSWKKDDQTSVIITITP